MQRTSLAGRSILAVEDERLIALDIADTFKKAGAHVTTTNTRRHALVLVDHDGLSAAVLDHALGDGDRDVLCRRLKERSIPFVNYSGFSRLQGACVDAPRVQKPASPTVVVETVVRLLQSGANP